VDPQIDGHDPIGYFMREEGEIKIGNPRGRHVREFCGKLTLEQLLTAGPNLAHNILYLVCVKSSNGWCLKSRDGPLNAIELLDALKHRPDTKRKHQVSTSTSPTAFMGRMFGHCLRQVGLMQELTGGLTRVPEIVYVTDLDPMTILALVLTTTWQQAPALRNALYYHITQTAFVGLQVSMGLTMFELAFHIPFRALRQGKVRKGLRRKTQDESFPDWGAPISRVLYSATYSFVLAGSDSCTWRGYCFIDTFFDADGQERETAQDHYDNTADEDSLPLVPLDPCSNCKYTTEMRAFDPRLRFMTVFHHRLHMATDEWCQVVDALQDTIDNCSKVRAHFSATRYPYTGDHAKCQGDNCPLRYNSY
jgi:hypothetical protein